MLTVLAETARITVVIALLMSAVWKFTNAGQYRIAMNAGLTSIPVQYRQPLILVVPYLETAVAVCALTYWPNAFLSVLPSVSFLTIASLRFLGLGDPTLAAGCGCWQPPAAGEVGPTPHLMRNAGLVLLGLIAMLSHHLARSVAEFAFVVPSAFFLAWLLMDLPNIYATIAAMRRTVKDVR